MPWKWKILGQGVGDHTIGGGLANRGPGSYIPPVQDPWSWVLHDGKKMLWSPLVAKCCPKIRNYNAQYIPAGIQTWKFSQITHWSLIPSTPFSSRSSWDLPARHVSLRICVKTTTGNRGSQAFFHHLVNCEPYLHSYGPLPVVGRYTTSFGHLWNVKYHRNTVIDTWGQQKKSLSNHQPLSPIETIAITMSGFKCMLRCYGPGRQRQWGPYRVFSDPNGERQRQPLVERHRGSRRLAGGRGEG